MPSPLPIDPAPRRYSAAVTLVRRSARGPASAPETASLAELESWLLGDASGEDDTLLLFESFAWRLRCAGLPVDRASLHVGTLHPQAIGFAWNWSGVDGLCDEVKVAEASLRSDAYRRNPLFRVVEHGETFRGDARDPAVQARYPFMAELGLQGFSEYVVLPLGGGGFHNAASVATRRPDGFAEPEMKALVGLLKLFALHVQRHIVLRIARNVLDTYLGEAAGRRVLEGSIRRGAGEAIRAVIWSSDLRGFTDMSGRLDGPETIAVLNAYFERMAGAVIARGGEVLKFMGDGLLAVFPYSSFPNPRAAAASALAAARDALAAVEALNADGGQLAGVEGWRPLKSGIGLHEGDVFFGNVGAAERLDFTVIRSAVNEASRIEGLTEGLGRPILLTSRVAGLLDEELDDLGQHALKGVAAPFRVFAAR